jgi:putative CocE/NonD family hydrolase
MSKSISIHWRVLLLGAALCSTRVFGVELPPAVGSVAVSAPAPRPQGWSDLSYYLPMPDGVRLAVSVWFPHGKVPTQHVPVLLIQTRYGRAGVFNYGEHGQYNKFLDAGFAVAVVDTRGTTSSFGSRVVEIGPREVADMNTLIRHFKTQPWSSGEVVATGVSYMADTADIASASVVALTASVVRESDFDAYLDLFNPGGVSNDAMMNVWGGDTLPRDYGRSANPKDALDCGARAQDCPKLWPRLQPVDVDTSYELLRAAIASRKQHWQPEDYRDVEFRDDKARNGYTVLSSSPAAYLKELNRQRTPAQYWGSWMDAGTADAALSRYRSMPDTSMEVWITAHNHNNDRFTDPFFPHDESPLPSFDDQVSSMLAFIARSRAHEPRVRVIHYYVLGAKTYKSTETWPPAGTQSVEWRFGPDQALVAASTSTAAGTDRYAVDFSATTGEATRWSTQLGTPAAYPDRRAQDAKLLTYTSPPFEQDTELVGTPAMKLYVATETTDPAFFTYLEDVAPDGRSTYLTEGIFRAVNRKPAASARLPYVTSTPGKSYLRKDAQPMVSGSVAEVTFPLFPVAALIKQGHRLRIALGGADTSAFRRYSNGKPDTWNVERTPDHPSSVTVNVRPWSALE